ncbi:hypothetical protein FA95DRAFT_1168913 [Auriscalpium vulgare]|uniref:Uncharacterized protein n=1 Tax=Auriscalpium vulgare TaxID=40419 RepID=A0ACB8SAA0_9AGAM|nr:hypothetical protein FA95DRAFT_1168913 [Auriscalpium vulgare]
MDSDEKFSAALSALDIDFDGKLVEIFTPAELLKHVLSPWNEFAADWTSRCLADGEVDWYLFGQVLQALVDLLNTLSRRFVTRVKANANTTPIPPISLDGVRGSPMLYDEVHAWLDSPALRPLSQDAQALLRSHQALGGDFPAHAFLEHLYDLAVRSIGAAVHAEKTAYSVAKTDITIMKQEMDQDVADSAGKLRTLFAFYVRPKRPAPDDERSGFRCASVLSISMISILTYRISNQSISLVEAAQVICFDVLDLDV